MGQPGRLSSPLPDLSQSSGATDRGWIAGPKPWTLGVQAGHGQAQGWWWEWLKAGIKYQPASLWGWGWGWAWNELQVPSPRLSQLVQAQALPGVRKPWVPRRLQSGRWSRPPATGRPGRARARRGPSGAPELPAGCGRGPGRTRAGPEPTPMWSGPWAAASRGRAVRPRTTAHLPRTCQSRRPGRTVPKTLCLQGRAERVREQQQAQPSQSLAPALLPSPPLPWSRAHSSAQQPAESLLPGQLVLANGNRPVNWAHTAPCPGHNLHSCTTPLWAPPKNARLASPVSGNSQEIQEIMSQFLNDRQLWWVWCQKKHPGPSLSITGNKYQLSQWTARCCEMFCQAREVRHKRSCIIWCHLYEMSQIGKSMETEDQWLPGAVGPRGWGMGSDCLRGRGLLLGAMKMVWN